MSITSWGKWFGHVSPIISSQIMSMSKLFQRFHIFCQMDDKIFDSQRPFCRCFFQGFWPRLGVMTWYDTKGCIPLKMGPMSICILSLISEAKFQRWMTLKKEPCEFLRCFLLKNLFSELVVEQRVFVIFVGLYSPQNGSHLSKRPLLYLDVPDRKWMDQWWSDQWVISPTYTWGIPTIHF